MEEQIYGGKYHPLLDSAGHWVGGKRNSNARLRLIEEHVDFTNKSVLDLGCSGGFFTFSLAEKARSITAIDANPDLISRNIETAKELGYENIEFKYDHINPDMLRALPKYDVVLFMAVFHHILASSDTYDWNDDSGKDTAQELLNVIRDIGNTYIFEMGRPEEGTRIGRDVRQDIGEPRDWVPQHVFGEAFGQVKVLRGVGYNRWPFRWFPGLAPLCLKIPEYRILGREVSGPGFVRDNLKIPLQDFREIYIGTKLS